MNQWGAGQLVVIITLDTLNTLTNRSLWIKSANQDIIHVFFIKNKSHYLGHSRRYIISSIDNTSFSSFCTNAKSDNG